MPAYPQNEQGVAVLVRVHWSLAVAVVAGAISSQPHRASAQTFERVTTSIIEDGQPVRLEVVIMKPSAKGPYPLAIVNHGSTGRGREPGRFKRTQWFRPIGEHLNRKGWIVAFPQRRGRGKSDGRYDEGFSEVRELGYSCEPRLSLAGADRALIDIDAAIDVLLNRSDVAGRRVLIGGVSRGGILSVAYAGTHPNKVVGVINFVGGWMGTGCFQATAINVPLFKRGLPFKRSTLWLYGDKDPYYSLLHTEGNFTVFKASGGSGEFLSFQVPSGNGHELWKFPHLWAPAVDKYLKEMGLDPPPKK